MQHPVPLPEDYRTSGGMQRDIADDTLARHAERALAAARPGSPSSTPISTSTLPASSRSCSA